MYIVTMMVYIVSTQLVLPPPNHPHAASLSPTPNHHNWNYLAGNKTVYVPGFASTLVLVSDFLFDVGFYILRWFTLIPTKKVVSGCFIFPINLPYIVQFKTFTITINITKRIVKFCLRAFAYYYYCITVGCLWHLYILVKIK